MAYGLTFTKDDIRKKKDSSSGTCSKNLFQLSTSQSRCDSKGKEIMEEVEVQREKGLEEISGVGKGQEVITKDKNLDIEVVAKSFGVVAISKEFDHGTVQPKSAKSQK